MLRTSVAVLLALALVGCSRQAPAPSSTPASPPVRITDPAQPAATTDRPPEVIADLPPASKQERYDAALIDTLNLLAERKLPEALAALADARKVQETEQVRRLAERIQGLMDEQTAARRTASDLRAAIDDGKADEAARLSSAALRQYGGTEAAVDLARVKVQAEALVSASAVDSSDRARRLCTDAQAALQDNNLRAAAISLEQAVQLSDDPAARRQLDDIRARLTRYDDNLRRARDLRRDPARLEEALAALQEAARAWDNLPLRQEIDDYTFALQKRRDRVGVTDFEVRGDIGVPGIGRSVAEELLPALKPRFDLVERGQVSRVLDELRLEGGDLLAQSQSRQEVGRLAGVRYLVVGSLTPVCGITAQARLVDVQSGLIVQTARVSAPNVEVLLTRMPLLGQMLLMTDEQKLAFEQVQAQKAPDVAPIVPIDEVPAPPPLPAVGQPLPPPVLTYSPRPPALGGLVVADFAVLPPVVAVAPPPAQVVIVREEPRRRLFSLCLELGDNLFRRGHAREAQRHFQLALSLGGDSAAVQLRIDRCRPLLPPPPPVVVPPVVVMAAPVVVLPRPVVRPRLVVFNFLLNCEPGLVPPSVGDWAADQFAACFGPTYDVIERGEVCWYMGRLGITMRDVLNDPSSRVALAQALDVRFFLFGAIEQTHSFNVTTHLIDAQTGARTGTGMIHVQDQGEMKLRLGELARQVGAAPAEQTKLVQAGRESEKALTESRKLLQEGSYTRAATVTREALKTSPNNSALLAVQQEAEAKARQVALADARRRQEEARKAELEAARKHQEELARQAEAARKKAQEEAQARDQPQRRTAALQKARAAEQLRVQADKALKAGNAAQAVVALQSAAALRPDDDGVVKDLARARTEQDRIARTRAEEEKARRDAELAKQRALAQAKVEAERKQHDAEEAARRTTRQAKDQADHAHLVKQAREHLAKKEYAQAAGALQQARSLQATDETERLLHEISDAQALGEARKKGERERVEAERRLAEDKARREKVEAEAKARQQQYLAELDQAQKAVAARAYDDAIAHFEAAGKLFSTDAVAAALKQARDLRDRDRSQRDAEVAKRQEEQRRAEAERARSAQAAEARRQAEASQKEAALKSALDAGRAHLAAGRHDEAAKVLAEVQRLAPEDPAVRQLAADLARANAAAGDAGMLKKRQADYQLAMDAGRKAVSARNYAGAVNAFSEALRLMPGDRDATALLEAAKRLRDAPPVPVPAPTPSKPPMPPGPPKPPPPDPRAEYARAMQAGAAFDKAKRYADAVNAYRQALRWQPGDAKATATLKPAEYLMHLDEGEKLLTARKFADAAKEFEEALKLYPDSKDARALLQKARLGKP